MTTKTSNVFARIESEPKEQAGGVPFPLAITPELPSAIEVMSKEQFDAELEKGYQDAIAGRIRPIDEFFDEMERKYKRY